jgi:hypothetical protein
VEAYLKGAAEKMGNQIALGGLYGLNFLGCMTCSKPVSNFVADNGIISL